MSVFLSSIPGLGPTSIADLAKLGVKTPLDLLEHYPSRYEDFSARRLIADVQSGEVVTVAGVITSIKARPIPGRKLTIIEGVITDATGSLNLIWFNQKFLMKTLMPGTRVLLSGAVEWQKKGLQMKSPAYEIQRAGEPTHTGRIVPIYPLTGSLTQKRLRTAIAWVLKQARGEDWLPSGIRGREQLVDLTSALKQIHFPDSDELRDAGKRRLQFNELFLYELAHLRSRAELKKLPAPAIPEAIDEVKKFVGELPFELTGAQRKSAWQILQDMAFPEPMNRLLEGDVGSGKTLVAAIAAVSASASGFQTAVLAPTEILAEQHAKTFQKYLGTRLRVGLITRTHGKELIGEVANGELDLIVGTHALLEEKIAFCKLGLVVVDEQHRFGVAQRQRLRDKQMEDGGLPHLLSMTATPIPRTLALTLYGDLDISVLDEMPKGRKAIKTTLITTTPNPSLGRRGATGSEEAFEQIRAELDAGRQAFFVCPLIDVSDEIEAKSVAELAESLKKGPLKGYKLATLHGRMKSEEKQKIMEEFVKGKCDVLVSTTVIEVGVDVPNATVMFVEGAERFGLAQLHQLRGRVGRSDMASYCYLRPSGFVPEATYARLRALVECQNGFELAERDLALRGPGDVYGTMQSGFEGFKLADLFNAPLISAARNEANLLLKNDPTFADHPALLARLGEYVRRIHFE